jgi:SAM-dependent methyltransferase
VSAIAAAAVDYSGVTEVAGTRVTREALSMLYTRYAFGASLAEGHDVLEVACGGGLGLGYLAKHAHRVVGGDYTAPLLARAEHHYQGEIPLLRLDAHTLPFRSASFGAVLLYEAIYYLREPDRFVAEAGRVLRSPGCLVISTVNSEWSDFNPSPLSTRYFSGRELASLLNERGFRTEIFGAFPVIRTSTRERAVSAMRRAAVRLRLIPPTMKGKEQLKRLFLGRLVEFPPEVTEAMAPYCPPARLSANGDPIRDFKVLFAVGRRS